jgi:hypothetical protein
LVTKNLTDDYMDHAVVIAFWATAGLLLRAATMHACRGRAV